MSTALTPAAPLVNLVLFGLVMGTMIAAAFWLDRRIKAGERDPNLRGGPARATDGVHPSATR